MKTFYLLILSISSTYSVRTGRFVGPPGLAYISTQLLSRLNFLHGRWALLLSSNIWIHRFGYYSQNTTLQMHTTGAILLWQH